MTFTEYRCRILRHIFAGILTVPIWQIRHESKDTAIPYGTFRYQCYDEHLYPLGHGGCCRRAEETGRSGKCQQGIGKRAGEADESENVSGNLKWKNARRSASVERFSYNESTFYRFECVIVLKGNID